jgi:hypothetical protein
VERSEMGAVDYKPKEFSKEKNREIFASFKELSW